MGSDFEKSLTFVLSAEGGYANNKNDKGGETYKGVARNYNPHWGGWVQIDLVKESGVINHQELTRLLDLDSE